METKKTKEQCFCVISARKNSNTPRRNQEYQHETQNKTTEKHRWLL